MKPSRVDVRLARWTRARLILRDPATHATESGALIRAWRDLPGLRDPGSVRRLAPSPDRQTPVSTSFGVGSGG